MIFWTTILLCFAIELSVLISPGCGANVFLESPSNAAVYDKESLTLACAANDTSEAVMISWKFTQFGIAEEKTIYNGAEVSPEFNRFKIRNGSHRCDLEMVEVRLTDAGVYECGIFIPESNIRENSAAHLIVIASEPNCSITSLTSGSYVEGEEIRMQCSITSKGRWTPVMQWEQIRGPVVISFKTINASIEDNRTSMMTFTLDSSHEGSEFICRVYFNQTNHQPNFSTNIPHYNFNWTASVQNITYGPTGISIQPLADEYSPGSTLTCSARANPTPRYTWEDVSTGHIIDGPVLRINDTMVGRGTYTFRCTAKTSNKSASRDHSFTVKKPGPETITLVSAICGSVLLACMMWIGAAVIKLKCRQDSAIIEIQSKSDLNSKHGIGDLIYADASLNKAIDENSSSRSVQSFAEVHKSEKMHFRKNTSHEDKTGLSHVGPDGTIYSELNPVRGVSSCKRHPVVPQRHVVEEIYAEIDHTLKVPPLNQNHSSGKRLNNRT